MLKETRFGTRIPVPSTTQIVHELRMLLANERVKILQDELITRTDMPDAPKTIEKTDLDP